MRLARELTGQAPTQWYWDSERWHIQSHGRRTDSGDRPGLHSARRRAARGLEGPLPSVWPSWGLSREWPPRGPCVHSLADPDCAHRRQKRLAMRRLTVEMRPPPARSDRRLRSPAPVKEMTYRWAPWNTCSTFLSDTFLNGQTRKARRHQRSYRRGGQ